MAHDRSIYDNNVYQIYLGPIVMPKPTKRPATKKPKMTPEQRTFADKFPGMTDDQVFQTMATIDDRKKAVVAQGGTWEDEGLLWKSLYTEAEIIRRNPGKWMKAYQEWSEAKAKNDTSDHP